MALIKRLEGQTNYDLAIQLYGNVIHIGKLMEENGISDDSILLKEYYFDESFSNSENKNYKYSTQPNSEDLVCDIPTNLIQYFSSYNSIKVKFDNPNNSAFEYFITTNINDDKVWIETLSNRVEIDNLLEATTYYFFLRKKCNSNLYSKEIMIECETILYVCNLVTGLNLTDLTSVSARVNWDPYFLSTVEYGFSIGLSEDPPLETNFTSESSILYEGLEPSTFYTFFIRRICDDIHFSSWQTLTILTTNIVPVTSGLKIYLDANTGVAREEGTDNVIGWNDLSGNDNHFLTLGGGPIFNISDPLFKGNSVVQLNAFGAIATMSPINLGKDVTFFVVARYNTADTGGVLINFKNLFSNNGFELKYLSSSSVRMEELQSTGGLDYLRSYYYDFLKTHVLEFKLSRTEQSYLAKLVDRYTNINESFSTVNTLAYPSSHFIIGADASSANSIKAKIAMLLVYNRLLDDDERTLVRNYLLSRYIPD